MRIPVIVHMSAKFRSNYERTTLGTGWGFESAAVYSVKLSGVLQGRRVVIGNAAGGSGSSA